MRFSVPTPTAWADPHVRFTRANAHFAHMPVTPRWLERRVLRGASSSGCSAHASASLSRHRFCTTGSPWTLFRHPRAWAERASGPAVGFCAPRALASLLPHFPRSPMNGPPVPPPRRCRARPFRGASIAVTSQRRRSCTGLFRSTSRHSWIRRASLMATGVVRLPCPRRGATWARAGSRYRRRTVAGRLTARLAAASEEDNDYLDPDLAALIAALSWSREAPPAVSPQGGRGTSRCCRGSRGDGKRMAYRASRSVRRWPASRFMRRSVYKHMIGRSMSGRKVTWPRPGRSAISLVGGSDWGEGRPGALEPLIRSAGG